MAKKTKSTGPFPVAEGVGGETELGGLQTSGSVQSVPADLKQEQLDAQLKSVMAEIKWRTDAMQHMTQQDASTYYQNNVKRLEDEVLNLKEQGAVEPEPEEEEKTEGAVEEESEEKY